MLDRANMRRLPTIGHFNAVLVALYFIPLWGREAVRSLTSSVYGLDERANMAAAVFYRQVFDLGHDGLARVASLLGGLKLVMAAMFVALVIDVSRGVAVGRSGDRVTLDVALFLAVIGLLAWAVPAYAFGFGDLVRHYATQFLLVIGVVIVTTVERAIEPAPEPETRQSTWKPFRAAAEAEPAAHPGLLASLGFVRSSNDNERAG